MPHTTHSTPSVSVSKPPARRSGLLAAFPCLVAAESTRHGGVSTAPFASMNLGLYTDDDPAKVSENRKRFFQSLGVKPEQVAGSHQVHGDQIAEINRPQHLEGYDALLTRQKKIFLTVTVADCTPVLIFDGKREAIAAVHAGWRGTVKEIVSKVLQRMHQLYGTKGADCFAYIGTCIDAASYEVDADVAGHFPERFKDFDRDKEKFLLDLKAANAAQLMEFGIPRSQIELSPFSTYTHNADYFSHRKEKGKTGRGLAVIGMR